MQLNQLPVLMVVYGRRKEDIQRRKMKLLRRHSRLEEEKWLIVITV
ncbi:hypothetical protein CANDROIZ_120005 [Candidatus Roizmanbacteria bacterium]|nr:hypothetical protein CANDROIZ_120005 [Candidatus Roizmanbacteria bacterium]